MGRMTVFGTICCVFSVGIIINGLYPYAGVAGLLDILETVGSAFLDTGIDFISWPLDKVGLSYKVKGLKTLLLPPEWGNNLYAGSIIGGILSKRKTAGPYPDRHFFSAGISLVKSNAKLVVFVLFGIYLSIMIALTFQKLFFGELRNLEIEHLQDNIGLAIMESFFAMALFRDEYDINFIARFVFLIIVKSFHWIIESRVDFMDEIEGQPKLSWLVQINSVFGLLFIIDSLMISYSIMYTITRGPSMLIVFGFEYAVLFALLLYTIGRFTLQMLEITKYNGRWDEKSTIGMYLELIHDFIKLLTYVAFFGIVVYYYFLPIYIIRDLYVTGRSFYGGIQRVIQYKKATFDMETKYPAATNEELDNTDRICVICRDDMVLGVINNADGVPNENQNDESNQRLKNILNINSDRLDNLLQINTNITDEEQIELFGELIHNNTDEFDLENEIKEKEDKHDIPIIENSDYSPKLIPRKLKCGHIFHTSCLKSWLERQQSCPTCRKSVLEEEKEPEIVIPVIPIIPNVEENLDINIDIQQDANTVSETDYIVDNVINDDIDDETPLSESINSLRNKRLERFNNNVSNSSMEVNRSSQSSLTSLITKLPSSTMLGSSYIYDPINKVRVTPLFAKSESETSVKSANSIISHIFSNPKSNNSPKDALFNLENNLEYLDTNNNNETLNEHEELLLKLLIRKYESKICKEHHFKSNINKGKYIDEESINIEKEKATILDELNDLEIKLISTISRAKQLFEN